MFHTMTDSDSQSLWARLQGHLPSSTEVRRRFRFLIPRIRARAREFRRRLRPADKETLPDRLASLDEEYVEEGAREITESDLDTVVEQADAIEERFRRSGPLRRLLEDGRLLLAFVRDVRHGRYRSVPVWSLSAVGFALLYVLNPFDVVPDALPVVGLIDDAAIVSACLALVEQDLHDYRAWRRAQQERTASDTNDDEGAEPLPSSS